MQTSLFDIDDIQKVKQSPSDALIISKKESRPLSKQQQTFNRLVRRIEKLRQELVNDSADLDKKLNYYGKYIHLLEQDLVAGKKEVVKLLYPFLANEKRISKKQREVLKSFLVMKFSEIFSLSTDEPDEELKEIYKKINGQNVEDLATEEFDMMKEVMEDMFEEFGFDVDLDDIDKDMSEEEIFEKMKAKQEEFIRQQEKIQEKIKAKKASGKKTDKQKEREEKERQLEEARNKNINTIYKQLAKALHPDLEQNEEMKLRKESLMKRLTVAHDNNDLHAMLTLEIEWIHNEERNTDNLGNEKLAIYNQVLKEQVKKLEEEKIQLMNHPRFNPLLRYLKFFFSNFLAVNLKSEKALLEKEIISLNTSIMNLKGKGALKEVKDIIRELEGSRRNSFNQFDSFFFEGVDLR